MAKKFHSAWRLLLGSLITLLGFAACKTTKKMQKGDDTIELYGPPPSVVDKHPPVDRMKLLYGVPAVRKEKMPE